MSSNPATTAAPTPSTKPPGAGLEGIVATQSGICFIDGQDGKLIYRGYEIGDLVEHCTFEEVAYLLWDGELPNRKALDELKRDLSESSRSEERRVGKECRARWAPYQSEKKSKKK